MHDEREGRVQLEIVYPLQMCEIFVTAGGYEILDIGEIISSEKIRDVFHVIRNRHL